MSKAVILSRQNIFVIRMNHLRHLKYERKQLKNAQNIRLLKVKNSSLKLKKDFKPINLLINDMDKFKQKKLS